MEEKTNIPIEQEGQMTIKKYKIDFQKLSDEHRKSLLTNPSQFIKEGFEKNSIRVKNIIDSNEPINKITASDESCMQDGSVSIPNHPVQPAMWHFWIINGEQQ